MTIDLDINLDGVCTIMYLYLEVWGNVENYFQFKKILAEVQKKATRVYYGSDIPYPLSVSNDFIL